nr:immunoglobulin heavy chain junction region [Mus musculus]
CARAGYYGMDYW